MEEIYKAMCRFIFTKCSQLINKKKERKKERTFQKPNILIYFIVNKKTWSPTSNLKG